MKGTSRRRRILRWCLPPALAAACLLGLVLRPYPVDALRPAASLELVDRSGAVLRRTAAATGGKQLWIGLGEVPPEFATMLIEAEDRRFFEHYGVDPTALVRSLWLNLVRGAMDFGGSTLSMQTVRLVRPHPRTLLRKLVEMIDAIRLERAVSKQQILEQYLNRAYFGHGATGLEAAAWRYFGHSARQLTAAEATLLAIVVRGPRVYDLVNHLDRALTRRDLLLGRLVEAGRLDAAERDAIVASLVQVAGAAADSEATRSALAPFQAGHFVDWVIEQLPDEIRSRGGTIRTTLDLGLQRRCEALVREHTDELAHLAVSQAGVVVLDAATGEVRALVGSRDYAEPERGNIDILTTPRNPGSSLKPFTYALALEQGDTPASIAADLLDSKAPGDSHNADGREHGPVRYAVALPSSYNLAALDVARRVGPARLLERLRRAGLTTLTKDAEHYGPELTLGVGKVKLLDLAAAYRFLVYGGEVIKARGVVEVRAAASPSARPPIERVQLFDEETSYLVSDMLSDGTARRAAFGDDLPVDLDHRVVAKTGTSGGFSDNVAVLATREYIVLAWAGNFDGPGMHKVLGMWGAAPLARRALLAASQGRPLTLPEPPATIVKAPICALSGGRPGARCPHSKQAMTRNAARDLAPCTWHRSDGSIGWPERFRPWVDKVRSAGGRGDAP